MQPSRFLSLALALASLSVATSAAAQPAPTVSVQVASATAPLPETFRADAAVLGYRDDSPTLVLLREGGGDFVCIASDPRAARFHAACYHASLEHFMARGRELRADGHGAQDVQRIRNQEVLDGRLPMPSHAALYSLSGPREALNTATGEVTGARPLYVLYVPMATAQSTGLPTRPRGDAPWLMDAGTPRAHVMFVPEM
jgi:hypothetical protein